MYCMKSHYELEKAADMISTDIKSSHDGALLPNGKWSKSTHVFVLSGWEGSSHLLNRLCFGVHIISNQMDEWWWWGGQNRLDPRPKTSATRTRPGETPCPGLQMSWVPNYHTLAYVTAHTCDVCCHGNLWQMYATLPLHLHLSSTATQICRVLNVAPRRFAHLKLVCSGNRKEDVFGFCSSWLHFKDV